MKSAVLLYEDLCAELLGEAPISDVSLASDAIPDLGEYKHGVKDREVDMKLMKTPKFLERLQAETAQKIPFNIKLVLIDGNHEEMFRRLSNMRGFAGYSTYQPDADTRRDTVSSLAASVWPPTLGVITLVFGSSGNPMKLSPGKKGVWMVGHKLGHAIFDASEISQLMPNRGICARINEEIEAYFKKLHPRGHPNKGNGLFELYKDISGFETAQTSNLQSHDEYLYELVAQYVMFGKVTFKVGNTFPTKEKADASADRITKMIVAAMNNAVGTTLVDVV